MLPLGAGELPLDAAHGGVKGGVGVLEAGVDGAFVEVGDALGAEDAGGVGLGVKGGGGGDVSYGV